MPTTPMITAIWILMVQPTLNTAPSFSYFSSHEKCQSAVAIIKKETGLRAYCFAQ